MTTNLSVKSFESTACYKCDGSGKIMAFAHVHAGDCFACGGVGYRLTERGKRQRAAYDAAMTIAAESVTVGQRINLGGFLGRVTVTGVEANAQGGTTISGETRTGQRVAHHGLPGSTVRRLLPRAELNALIAECLEIL